MVDKREKGGEVMERQKKLSWEIPCVMKLAPNTSAYGQACTDGQDASGCGVGTNGGCSCLPGSAATTCGEGAVAEL
jgi:hypothetical protein